MQTTRWPARRELSNSALVYELEAFVAYRGKGGRLTIYEWMDSKDFVPADRRWLVVAYRAMES